MAEEFQGTVTIKGPQQANRDIVLSGNKGSIEVGKVGAGRSEGIIALDSKKAMISTRLASSSTKYAEPVKIYAGSEGVSPQGIHKGIIGKIEVGGKNCDGKIEILNSGGKPAITASHQGRIDAGSRYQSGSIFVWDDSKNKATIVLSGREGDIKLAGSDCAEVFSVDESADIKPGTVMVMTEDDVLRACDTPYDKRVAGVVSGADGCKPGVLLGHNNSDNHKLPIGLSGKVFCWVDADYSSVEVGDLLTTSPTFGHAMKAVDSRKAFGAILGKAMRPLNKGKDLVPVLITLQ